MSIPRSPARRAGAFLVGLAALLASCDDSEPGVPDRELTLEAVRDFADELNDFWLQVGPEIGITYVPVPRSRVTDGTTGATCDGEAVRDDSDDLDGNAFVDGLCTEGILVGADLAYLHEAPLQMEMTLAHEWGHVLQAQAPEIDAAAVDGLDIDAELQADCLSGVWAGATLDDGSLAIAEQRVAEVGDEPGVALDDPDAHGTTEERVAAFRLGVTGGAPSCVGDDLYEVLPE